VRRLDHLVTIQAKGIETSTTRILRISFTFLVADLTAPEQEKKQNAKDGNDNRAEDTPCVDAGNIHNSLGRYLEPRQGENEVSQEHHENETSHDCNTRCGVIGEF